MAIKQPALIIERDNRKKKKEKQLLKSPTKNKNNNSNNSFKKAEAIIKQYTNNKGTTKINRNTISRKPTSQNTTQNRLLTNKDRLTSLSSFGGVKNNASAKKRDIRTVKSTKNNNSNKKVSVGVYDIYERDGRYYYNNGKKEKEIDRNFVQNALKNNKTGVIGNYSTKGELRETDKRGNVIAKEKNILKKAGRVVKGTALGIGKGFTSIADAGMQETRNDLQKGEKIDNYKDLAKNEIKALIHGLNPTLGRNAMLREAGKSIKSLWKDDNKTLGQKIVGTGLETTNAATFGDIQGLKESIRGLGAVDHNADEKVKQLQNKIDEPINKRLEELEKEGYRYDPITNTLTNWNRTVGQMGPGIAVGAFSKNPELAIATMGLSAKGQATERAEAAGADLDTATKMGTAAGWIEAATEKLTGGAKIFGGGALDDIVEGTINSKIKNKGINFIAKQGYGLLGETMEETLSDLAGVMIDRGTINPKAKYTLDDFLETAKNTFGSTFILNLLTGGYGGGAYRANVQNMQNYQQQQANEVAQRVESGEIDVQEGNALLEQIKDGTYQQNRNLEQIATQERQNLVQAAQQGLITPEQYTQGLQTLANTVNQTREEINTPQQDAYEEIRNELRKENEGTQQTETTSNQQESTQESTFNDGTIDDKLNNTFREAGLAVNDAIMEQAQNGSFDATDLQKRYTDFVNEHKSDFDNANNKNVNSKYYLVDNNLVKVTTTTENGKIYIDELYVEKQNNGTGTKVVDAIKDYAKANNLEVEASKELQSAKGFWDKALDRNNNVETNQKENIPATKNENVISEEVKPQKQETTNENVNQESKTEQVETQQEEKQGPEILDKMPTEKKSIFNKLKEKYNAFRHHFTDHREAWYDLSRETRNPALNSRADAIDLANGKAQVDIGEAQIDSYNGKRFKNFTDENGNKVSMSFEGAYDLYNKIPVKAKNEFLVHNLNIDRLNQGVDQFEIPIQESQAKLEELRKTYPDIDKWSENIYQYYRNLSQKLVDGGRLPQSKVNEWQTATPHYVHIQRDMGQKGNSGVDTKNGRVDSDRLIQKVKGGNYPILPIKQTTADFTRNSIEALQFNNLGKEYLKTVGVGSRADGTQQINDMDDIFGINQDLIKDDGKGNYTFVVYDKGIPVEVPISKDMYEGLKPRDIRKVAVTSDIVKLQREIITNKNPVFGFVRNPGRDLQAMLLYSKHPAYKSLSTYNKLFTERTLTKNKPFSKEEGAMPQEIVELYYDQGNQANSFYNNGEFESEKSKNKIAAGVEKALSPVEKGANFMESMPRITEFWNTVQSEGYTVRNGEVISRKEAITQQAEEDLKNNKITPKEYNKRLKKAQKMKNPTKSVEQVLMEASHDAAEITVNFKRGGTWGKNLDKNFAVYSSPAIQGAAKFGRTITEAVGDAKHGDFKAAKRLVSRAAALGIAPALLSEAMYGDDDDYKDIQEYQKDQYYLIKRPNGKWLRIPKGREISTIQSLTRRGMNKASGEKDAFKGYGSFAINQVGPTNPLESNFASPLISAFLTNRSWSGNPIVSDYMKNNFADEDQYNEKTDELSKWIGKKTGISPMKINYILDQYSGGLGDVALPYITPKASNDAKDPISSILKNELTFDQANSSKSVSKFYDAKNEINKAFKKRNASDEDKVKKVYMGTISQSLFDLSTKKREIQMDKNLSKKEKYEQALDVQKKMNKLTSDAVKNLDKVDVGENTATIGGILLYKNKNSKNGWSQESEKATKNREKLGLSPEKYYYYKNEESYTPPGSEYATSITRGKNAKYNIAIVDAFNFDPSDYLEYKYKLSKIRGNKDSRGRTIRYSARNKKLKYLNTLPISAVEKAYLMKQNDKYYKGSDYNLKKAISNSSLSNKEKKELYSYLGLGR